METKRLLFIVNPISGTKNKQPLIDSLPSVLDSSFMEWSVKWTEYAGHAAELACKAAADGIDICVAIGGDGTVNEVARALCHTNTSLGIIPMGSGNGLARHLGLPLNAKKALSVVAKGIITTVDSGEICGHPFFCTCGVGFDAFISDRFAQKKTRGIRTYARTMFTDGLSYKGEQYTISVDDGEPEEVFAYVITCGNAAQYGNDFYIAPHASMKDGFLDVTIMTPFPLYSAPKVLFQMHSRKLDNNSHVRTLRCKNLLIHRAEAGPIHFDGDPIQAGKEVEISIKPESLRVVVPPSAEPNI